MNKIKYIQVFAIILLLTSCDSFLDIKPKGVKQPSSYEDYEKLSNPESMFMLSAGKVVGYMTDDATPKDPSRMKAQEINAYTYQPKIYDVSQDDPLWNREYSKIYIYNTIIAEVLDSKGDEAKKKALRAQALFSRAYLYFRLVNMYAKPYTQANLSAPAVPYVKVPDVSKSGFSRGTIKEFYEQVKADLDEAFKDLSEDNKEFRFDATKTAYFAMLARFYLYQGEYQKALKAQELYDSLHPMATIQSIFARVYMTTLDWNVYLSDDLLKVYNTDATTETDQRYQLFTQDDKYGDPSISAYNSGLTTAEMYLIASECEARIGSITRAMELVNTLRKNRIKNAKVLQTTDKQKALTYVLNERRKEFAGRPEFRLIDLKRLGLGKEIGHESSGKIYTANTNDVKLFILPIPPNVINFNTGMEQNER